MTTEASQEVEKFQKQFFSILHGSSSSKYEIDSTSLRKLIPIGDHAIEQYKNAISKYKFDLKQSLGHIIQSRLKAFQKSHINSLDSFFTKSYKHLNDIITLLDKESDGMKQNYELEIVQTQNELKLLKLDKERELEILKNDAQKIHDENMAELKKKLDTITGSSKSRVDEETQRIVEHFEKQLAQKNETYDMITAAIEKAEQELVEEKKARKAELTAIVIKNDEILANYTKKLNDRKKVLDLEVEKLQKEYNSLHASQQALAPELDAKWEKRSLELEQQFGVEKDKLSNEITEKTDEIAKLKETIQNLEKENVNQKEESIKKQKQQIEELKTQLKDEEKLRNQKIQDAKEESKKKYEKIINELKSNLETIKKSIENDRSDFEKKADEKRNKYQQRIQSIQKEHDKAINELNSEIEIINQEISRTKEEWEQQRMEIEEGYNKDISDISTKETKDDSYFEAKLAALKRELAYILEESEVLATNEELDKEDEIEIEKTGQMFQEEEKKLANDLTLELGQKVSEKVNEKMAELRRKHEKEREVLLTEAQQLEEKEKELQQKLDEETKKAKEIDPEQNPVQQIVSAPGFLDAQIDKWRESYFVETKNLKHEEAEALQHLDHCKVEFKEAVARTVNLRNQLKESTQKYEEALEKARAKGGEELEELRLIVEEKEKEIIELEQQFDENEQEVRKKIQMIDEAEDKLTKLRTKLAEEKSKIKEVIKKEYQPLINQEQRRSEVMVSELEKLRNELELSVEYLKHDLFGIETSNAAMEEDLKNETDKIIQNLQEELRKKYEEIEEEFVSKMSQLEIEKQNQIDEEINKMEVEVEEIKQEKEIQIQKDQDKYNEQIEVLNKECLEILTLNSEKQELIRKLKEKKCDMCPILDKNLKKLEKALVRMQIQDRDLALDGQNKRDMIHKLGNLNQNQNQIPSSKPAKLPMLPSKPK